MNENIDLTKILKNCPKGYKFYSLLFGEVEFQQIRISFAYPIDIKLKSNIIERVTSDGKLFDDYDDGECILFPSKEQRDWSKFTAPWYNKERFDPKTLKPFDKVIGKDLIYYTWKCDLFSNIVEHKTFPYRCMASSYQCCIPYNDETKHLIGTKDEAPEYYRYWED